MTTTQQQSDHDHDHDDTLGVIDWATHGQPSHNSYGSESFPVPTPPGARTYSGPLPSIIVGEHADDQGQLLIPLDAPSWIVLWAFREVKRRGWHTVDPDASYVEADGNAVLQILSGPGLTRP